MTRSPETWVDLERDHITLDQKPVRPGKKIYLLLYKPRGYLTTRTDPQGRRTVYDLIGDVQQWVSPVGRLDQETSGLLVMTNDTQMAERVTNPVSKIPKTYQAKCATRLDEEQLERLRQGVQLKDGPTRPALVRRIRESPGHSVIELTITEGRNRQVRRMIEAVDSKVLKLVRTAIGAIRIGQLGIGKHRPLSAAEVRLLMSDG